MMPQFPSKEAPWGLIQFSEFVDCSLYTFNILRCSAGCRTSGMWVTFNRFLTIFEAFMPLLFALHSLHHPKKPSESSSSFHGRIFKLNLKFHIDSLCYLFILNMTVHTRHILTQWHPPPPPTSTVKSSLFTHVHSPWLPGYFDDAQTILVILTVGGTFQDQPCIFVDVVLSSAFQYLF